MRTKFLLFVLAVMLVAVPARPNIHNLADISGSNTTVQISTDGNVRAAWIQVIAPSTNASVVRFGDSTVTSSKGLPIAAGGGYNTPACSSCVYSLTAHYVYVASGDSVSIAWGN